MHTSSRPEDLSRPPVTTGVGGADIHQQKMSSYDQPIDALSGKSIAEGRPVVTVNAVPAATASDAPLLPSHLTAQQPVGTTTSTTTTTAAVKPGASVSGQEEQLPGRRRVWLAQLAQRDYKTTLNTWRERIVRFARSNTGWAWLPAALALLTALVLGSLLVRSDDELTFSRVIQLLRVCRPSSACAENS